MSNIYLMRHCEPDFPNNIRVCLGSSSNPGLSAEGEEHAKNLRRFYGKHSTGRIYTSPLKRCVQTAELISSETDTKLITVPEAIELFSGDWDGLTFEEIERRYPGSLEEHRKNPTIPPPNGETDEDGAKRLRNALLELLSNNAGEDIVLVTSGSIIRAFSFSVEIADDAIINSGRVKYGTVTRIVYEKDRFILKEYGVEPGCGDCRSCKSAGKHKDKYSEKEEGTIMQKLFKELHDRISSGEDAVLVTIVASSGSTPRGSGARMLMTKEGHIAGTVGGGAVEYECEKLALKALENKGSTSEYFRLHKNDVADIGMICGGDVDVYFKYIPAGDEYMISLTQKIDEMFEKGEQCWLITEITEDNNGIVSVYSKKNGVIGKDISNEVIEKISNRPVQIETETTKYYCEKLVQAGRVIIIGGGHVSQQLVPTLARCDFRTMVVESRKEFANPALFEGVNEVRLVNMEDMSEIVSEVTEDDYICIMTRGHKDDYVAQRNLLKTPACYIGVIGSRHKVAGVNAKLKADGFTDEDINRITTPIGIDICSETPAEIAVAITAQLIELRAKRNDTRKFRTRG